LSAAAAGVGYAAESALAERWAAAPRGPLRLEDGRALKVIFPGVHGGASGPDFRDAMLDADGDILRGDVELHLRASGWRAHGHHVDDAYGGVALHVVAENDVGALSTLHASGRAIAVLVLPPLQGAFAPPFTPPCALRVAQGSAPGEILRRLGQRRLRMKAARLAPVVHADGAGQALYGAALEILGGPANRGPFAALARRLPLAALVERAGGSGAPRGFTLAAELKGAAAALAVRRAGLRPMASPGRRLEVAGAVFARWWPDDGTGWPGALDPGGALPRPLPAGMGRASAIELAVNAVLPVALAAGVWSEAEVVTAWESLPSPGSYGRVRRLEGWLGGAGKPFMSASALQGGLLLHTEWCTRGGCGRCPLSE
jgi:hypothetical protein